MVQRSLAMGRFIGAKILDRLFQCRITGAQGFDLGGVMFVNRFFHRGGAGKGGFFAHQGCGRAQRKTGDAPEWLQRGGPHPAFIDQGIEGFEMLLFLLSHVANGGFAGAALQHGKLAFVNAHRAIFPGMIHPDHGIYVRRGAGRIGLGFTRHFSLSAAGCFPVLPAGTRRWHYRWRATARTATR